MIFCHQMKLHFGWYQKMLTKYKNEMLVIKILKYCYFMGHIDSPIIEKKYKGEQVRLKNLSKYSELPDSRRHNRSTN